MRLWRILAGLAVCGGLAGPAGAVDGVVLIDQAKVNHGNITPGDAPGFPVSITRRGSYRLDGSLQVPAGKDGIDIFATEVSIDLNGFVMDGGGVASSGIEGTQRSLTVRNGTIRAFTDRGIETVGALGDLEDLRVEENGGIGILADQGWARIANNIIFGNGVGIECADGCQVEGNVVSNSRTNGIHINGGTVLGNTITGNNGFGLGGGGFHRSIGYGNNTLSNNGQSVAGPGFVKLFPNACSPGC